MLKRKAYDGLVRWKKEKTTQGMLVMGARQVGKTTTVRSFAHDNYDLCQDFGHKGVLMFFRTSGGEDLRVLMKYYQNQKEFLSEMCINKSEVEPVLKLTRIFLKYQS